MAEVRPHRRDDRPPTLAIRDLRVEIETRRGRARVVEDMNLDVWPGEIVGLIGESGSGKTMTALAVLGLMPRQAGIAAGGIDLAGRPLTELDEAERRAVRGDRVAYIPQDALRALNPVLRIDTQVGEPYRIHRAMPWKRATARAVELLRAVHLAQPEQRAQEYPHQFSGGMQQRAMIAMGLALEPELLIADEPTTALDVTVQAQVLKLLREIRDTHGTAILLITHDLGVIAGVCDWVYVMYAGAVLEQGPVRRIFERPAHPYTQALLRATPTVRSVQEELLSIPGQIPPPYELPLGCRFADRCPRRFDRCASEPAHLEVEPGHTARCWLLAAPAPLAAGRTARAGRDA
ncbi:MAG TPA: ABC transporter ATP-binding protein [Dongiaceae bacterium]|nr:ABC transporter ATP-binding protein [Dongiaceae bacterium]